MDFQVLLLTIGVSFILAVIAAPLLIPLLRRMKFGQQVREDGPQSHLKKSGTPTMGGVVILLAFTLAFLKFSAVKNTDFYVLLVATLGFGLIGFLDDYIKIVFKRSLGLTARQKMLGLTVLQCPHVLFTYSKWTQHRDFYPGNFGFV